MLRVDLLLPRTFALVETHDRDAIAVRFGRHRIEPEPSVLSRERHPTPAPPDMVADRAVGYLDRAESFRKAFDLDVAARPELDVVLVEAERQCVRPFEEEE